MSERQKACIERLMFELSESNNAYASLEDEMGALRAENERLQAEHDEATEYLDRIEALMPEPDDTDAPSLAERMSDFVDTLNFELASAEAATGRLAAALEQVKVLTEESRAVTGLHLNGDEASWEWLIDNEWLPDLATVLTADDRKASERLMALEEVVKAIDEVIMRQITPDDTWIHIGRNGLARIREAMGNIDEVGQ